MENELILTDEDFFTTDDLTDVEAMFPQRDLFYGQDGNLYSESDKYKFPLAIIKESETDEDGNAILWKVAITDTGLKAMTDETEENE